MHPTRRTFLKSTAAATLATAAGPIFLHAAHKAGSKLPVMGSGEHTYECMHSGPCQ